MLRLAWVLRTEVKSARCLTLTRSWRKGISTVTAQPQPAPAVGCATEVADTLKVAALVQTFRSRGHLAAQLDPLGRVRYGPWLSETGSATRWGDPGLTDLLQGYDVNASADAKACWAAKQLGLKGPTDGARLFCLDGIHPGGNPGNQEFWTLPEVIERMRDAYCGTLSVELDHLATREQQQWMAARIETPRKLPDHHRLAILRNLIHADAFEDFLADKFPTSKRFGVEGCEALLPGMAALVERCAEHGIQRMEVGMPHRGRLNVLCNILGKSPGALYGEMEGRQSQFHVGDVKYHLGQSASLTFPRNGDAGGAAEIRLSIAPNPSHLEAVDPVVLGMVRAEQTRLADTQRSRVMGLLIHGDAAFAGLGIVTECLQLSNVPGFTTGGTIHLIINNQVGFTTAPSDGRSSPHPTDVAKTIGAPILHANADDPEAVVHACVIAADWRAHFKRDCVVDIVGFRRHGHNELDDPLATLPLTYRLVDNHPASVDQYAAKLQQCGVTMPEAVKACQAEAQQWLQSEYDLFEDGKYEQSPQDWLTSSWQGDALQWVGSSICRVPEGFHVHPAVQRMLDSRRRMVQDENSRVDWAMAEALAFGTLMLHRGVRPPQASAPALAASAALDQHPTHDGDTRQVPALTLGTSTLGEAAVTLSKTDPQAGLNLGHYGIRLTGQDVERGTFDQRHSVLYDQQTGRRLVALNHIKHGSQDRVEVWNSPLNEAAVLGFEYGYSLGCARSALVLWEAQFGDFANNAQVIIDQFVAAGEERWGQQSGLVLMLPHGYDGQGPDHSSARLERFLSLANDDADHLPGHSPAARRQINATFDALARNHGGRLDRHQTLELLQRTGADGGVNREVAETIWTEMGLAQDAHITQNVWQGLMVQYIRRNAERQANMFVVNATTPAQLFHALRRQMNRPFLKPLILLTPKWLLHHRPCTSALKDLVTGTFFNRVIDDGKASDNTRHLGRSPETGAPYLLPPEHIRRVILCSGQIYYKLSHARRARKIRDIVMVRLEQIAPFPHDLVIKAVTQYVHAEVLWCQEEPKNMGAWLYVKPRMDTAMRELFAVAGMAPRRLRYVGRPAAASPATASTGIHQDETKEVVDLALSPSLMPSGSEDYVMYNGP
ncbi:hypothetical protein WJX72_003602 [[Myrmecia] bisecta]|uniref:Transketolase-like pyrimidine-binding domain-containing protein n=1 Tax=[Myrmecia] bisecta TaxID=41462 RepID=A0AAW1PN48_9CHLO